MIAPIKIRRLMARGYFALQNPEREVRRTFSYRESGRVEREVLVVTRRRKTEKEVRLLPKRHGLGRDCLHKNSGTEEATLLRIARPFRKERGGPGSIPGGPARTSGWTASQDLGVRLTALFRQLSPSKNSGLLVEGTSLS